MGYALFSAGMMVGLIGPTFIGWLFSLGEPKTNTVDDLIEQAIGTRPVPRQRSRHRATNIT